MVSTGDVPAAKLSVEALASCSEIDDCAFTAVDPTVTRKTRTIEKKSCLRMELSSLTN
jgi:hypothetical protein